MAHTSSARSVLGKHERDEPGPRLRIDFLVSEYLASLIRHKAPPVDCNMKRRFRLSAQRLLESRFPHTILKAFYTSSAFLVRLLAFVQSDRGGYPNLLNRIGCRQMCTMHRWLLTNEKQMGFIHQNDEMDHEQNCVADEVLLDSEADSISVTQITVQRADGPRAPFVHITLYGRSPLCKRLVTALLTQNYHSTNISSQVSIMYAWSQQVWVAYRWFAIVVQRIYRLQSSDPLHSELHVSPLYKFTQHRLFDNHVMDIIMSFLDPKMSKNGWDKRVRS